MLVKSKGNPLLSRKCMTLFQVEHPQPKRNRPPHGTPIQRQAGGTQPYYRSSSSAVRSPERTPGARGKTGMHRVPKLPGATKSNKQRDESSSEKTKKQNLTKINARKKRNTRIVELER